MKLQSIFATLLLMFVLSASSFAQKSKTEDIKVWGNCGMCKKTIESAAIGAGASAANWNTESKVLTVSYNTKKVDQKKIQEAVAASGYDTQDMSAPNEAYDKLHGCCKYDRKAGAAQVAAGTSKASCGMENCTMENCDHKDKAQKDCCKAGNCEKDKSCCKEGKCEKGKACCKA